MKRIELLKKQQVVLKEHIGKNLDLLIGSVVRSPAMMYHSLTAKVEGKTVTRYTLCAQGPGGQSEKNDRSTQTRAYTDSKAVQGKLGTT
jgi:hypothetical protein